MKHIGQPLRVRTFVYTKDEKRNISGWKPEGTDDSFYPGPGHLVYHDTVEHFGNAEGWDRELLAFGATMYGRMHYDAQMTEVNAQDFVGFLQQDQKYLVPPCKPQYYDKKLPEKDEEFLSLYMEFIKAEIQHRQNMLNCLVDNIPLFAAPYNQASLDEQLRNAAAWFRRGWFIARRLHHGQGFNNVINLMRRLTRAVNQITSDHNPQPGDKLTVRVNRADSTFTVAMA